LIANEKNCSARDGSTRPARRWQMSDVDEWGEAAAERSRARNRRQEALGKQISTGNVRSVLAILCRVGGKNLVAGMREHEWYYRALGWTNGKRTKVSLREKLWLQKDMDKERRRAANRSSSRRSVGRSSSDTGADCLIAVYGRGGSRG
jgi:hypothetical protein